MSKRWANAGLVVAYILFAVAGVCIIAGASIHYGADTWNVLDIVQRWDSLFARSLRTGYSDDDVSPLTPPVILFLPVIRFR